MITEPNAYKKSRIIKQITVKKLFGLLDHTIPLNTDETVNMLVGASGIGKTTILKLLVDLFSPKNAFLQSIPFSELRLDFLDEEEEEVEYYEYDEDGNYVEPPPAKEREPFLTSLWVTKGDEPSTLTFHARDSVGQEQAYTLELPPLPDGAYSFEDLPQHASEPLSGISIEQPTWLTEARQAVHVHYLGTQRALSFPPSGQNGSTPPLAVPTADLAIQELNALLKTEQASSPELARHFELFEEKINKYFLFKKVSISQETGIRFTSENGVELVPSQLSLGEQQVIILFWELLFKVSPYSLVLIDDPEISLHIVWQRELTSTLSSLGSMTESKVLIVTHAPTLIRNRWDRVVALERGELADAA